MGIKQAVNVGLNFNQKSVIVGLNMIKFNYGFLECTKVEHISYTTCTCALPDIYTLALRPHTGITITYILLGQANLITCFSSLKIWIYMRAGGHFSLFIII